MQQFFFTLLILFGIGLGTKAQSTLQGLRKYVDFKPILQSHLKEMKKLKKGGWTPVSALLIRSDTSEAVIYLTSIALLSELEKHLPASYEFIEGHPFIIYDGSERLISDTLSWFGELKSKIGYRLCDNVTYLEEYKKPGPKEVKIPCSFFYDSPIERFTFRKGKLIEKKVVAAMPF
ncbi:hypothetical protein ACS5NO_23270 [Larkinella sp. GY13]|uniref:hypothetical protein n=1 Tax=Larkinella sp. GY13 TaxID=3453720 RepID=UPI003EE94735